MGRGAIGEEEELREKGEQEEHGWIGGRLRERKATEVNGRGGDRGRERGEQNSSSMAPWY